MSAALSANDGQFRRLEICPFEDQDIDRRGQRDYSCRASPETHSPPPRSLPREPPPPPHRRTPRHCCRGGRYGVRRRAVRIVIAEQRHASMARFRSVDRTSLRPASSTIGWAVKPHGLLSDAGRSYELRDPRRLLRGRRPRLGGGQRTRRPSKNPARRSAVRFHRRKPSAASVQRRAVPCAPRSRAHRAGIACRCCRADCRPVTAATHRNLRTKRWRPWLGSPPPSVSRLPTSVQRNEAADGVVSGSLHPRNQPGRLTDPSA
jgi:hypothetical protein